jgi:hypothetical protein
VFLERSVKYRAVAVVFALIALSPSGTPADQQATRVCLFLPAANTEEVNKFRSIVIVELTREMEKRGFAIIPEQTWRAKLSQEELSSVGLLQSSAAVQLAERAEADIALIGSIQIEGRDIILRIRGYDVATGSLMFSGEKRGAKDIGIYNRVSSLPRELTDALLGWAESQPGTIALPQSETSVLEGELAARPPAFLSIVPDTVLAGKAQSLLVTVDNLSRDGSVSLVSPSGSVIPASVDRVSRTTLRIGLPALDQVGEYSLALTNPPDLTTTVGAALRVRYPSPTVTALEPDRFQSDHAPRTLRLRGGDFSPQATVSVNVDGNSVDLPAVSREAGDLIVSLSEILEPGEYRLAVRNGPNGDPVEAPILTVTHPDPTITRLEPDQFQVDRIPPTLSLLGGGFSPQVTISMMIDGESVDLPLVYREPGSLRVGLPRTLKPGDYALTVRNAPDANGVDSPLFHVIPLLPLAAAKVPVRDFLVSCGWNYLIPLSRWADIYSPTPQGVELGVDCYFTPNRVSARRTSVNAGARMSMQYCAYSSTASSGVFVESVLTMYSLSMAPSLELALPFLMLRLYSGGGVVYSKVEGESAAGDTQSAESIDFLAMARFAVDVPLSGFLRVGVAAEYRHFFLTEPMDAFLLETGLAVAFPLY